MARDSIFTPLFDSFKILSWIAAPLFLIYQLQQIAKPEDKVSKSLRKANYILSFNKGNKTYTYKFTIEDIINLMRSVYKEGSQEIGVAYSLLSRFALLYPDTYNNFTTFLKAYVQPISPKWFPGGSKFVDKYGNNPPIWAIEKGNERIKNSQLSLSEIPKYEIGVVADIFGGKTSNPVKGSIHYIMSLADSGDTEEQAREKQLEFANSRPDLGKPIYYQSSRKGNNWFFGSPNSVPNIKITKQIII